MIEHIEQELRGAVSREILELFCTVPKCSSPVAGILHLGYSNGRHNLYAGCQEHLREFEAKHPRLLGARGKQSFFYF